VYQHRQVRRTVAKVVLPTNRVPAVKPRTVILTHLLPKVVGQQTVVVVVV
jgi:hypothetical protein